MENELKNLLAASSKIVVTSHISPDADAVSSLLLLSETLRINYPRKQILAVLEEKPDHDFSFLDGYNNIEFRPLAESLGQSPDLLIITDANKLERVSRNDWQKLGQIIQQQHLKTVVIDHHEDSDKDEVDIFINNKAPAATQEVFILLFEKLAMTKPKGYAQPTMLGILSDTNRFKYYNPAHRQTFRIVSDMIDEGVSIEKLENRLSRYSSARLNVLRHLLENLASLDADYSYSFIDDEFAAQWQAGGGNNADYKIGLELFINQYIRNIDDNFWGFVVYPDIIGGQGQYQASFRSVHGYTDVSKIAQTLGGGGHKSAAAAKIKATSVHQAIDKVRQAIKDCSP